MTADRRSQRRTESGNLAGDDHYRHGFRRRIRRWGLGSESVSTRPETQYVEVGDADVAYQVIGDGPADLLVCFGLGSDVDANWDVPSFSRFIDLLASSFRVIVFDRRGTGASDGVPRNAVPTIEDWTDDIGAVLDATGSRRANIYALIDTGPIAIVYGAMHPERVNALVLLNSYARVARADDYPIGVAAQDITNFLGMVAQGWGTARFSRLMHPGASAEHVEAAARVLRASATPRTATAQYESVFRQDVRYALSLVQVPTLVLQATDDPFHPAELGRYLAEHIEGATLIEFSNQDLPSDVDSVNVDAIIEFLTGERPVSPADRVLTTVLFTDIVGSTEQLTGMGDRNWRDLLDRHDAAVRAQLGRFNGREISTTGDGFFATFDGPARAIRCAQVIIDAADALGIRVRAGVHTGECDVRGDDLGGIAVVIGARVAALASAGQILTTGTVRDLVAGSDIAFTDQGLHDLKGIPEPWHLYEANS
jgi:class 3 adenylate cyclase/alpha-beta hydrolase superfamily lysophospholipase